MQAGQIENITSPEWACDIPRVLQCLLSLPLKDFIKQTKRWVLKHVRTYMPQTMNRNLRCFAEYLVLRPKS
jgi:hypothetical protein